MAFPTAVKMASALEALGQEAAKTVRAKMARPIAEHPANTARDGGDVTGAVTLAVWAAQAGLVVVKPVPPPTALLA
jgi:hypothetical protein